MTSKKNFLTLREKIEVLKKLENGADMNKLMIEYNIGRTTIRRIRSEKETLMRHQSVYVDSMNRKKHSSTSLYELEKSLYKWFLFERVRTGQTPNGPMIKSRAICLKEEMQIPGEFRFSEGWLTCFKKRFGIKIKNKGNGSSSNNEEPDEQELQTSIEMIPNTSESVRLIEDANQNGYSEHEYESSVMEPENSSSHPFSHQSSSSKTSKSSFETKYQQQRKEQQQQITSKEVILSWEQAEVSINRIVEFFEHHNLFGTQDCLQAHMLRNTFLLARMRHHLQQTDQFN